VKLILSIWLIFLTFLVPSWGNFADSAFGQNLTVENGCLLQFPLENWELTSGIESSSCHQISTVSVEEIDPHAAIIYPIILSDRIEVTISIPQQPLHHHITLIPQVDVEAAIAQMRKSMRQTSFEQERLETAQKIYTWLIDDADLELAAAEIKTLVFAMNSPFSSLPLAALHDGKKYLIEKYEIVISPQQKIYPPQPIPANTQAIIAGISKPNQEFDSLPGVEQEINQISQKLSATILLDESFTLENLQKHMQNQAVSILHLATHAQFSSQADNTFILAWNQRINPQQLSHLLRVRNPETSPIDLLVLSACQTAKGDSLATLGFAGIASNSGVRSTLASLWTVNDTSTVQFMNEFYHQLLIQKVTKAAALRQAQLYLLQQTEFKHPYHWAPFIIVGNWL
jgi:CHAT domain-containing protein